MKKICSFLLITCILLAIFTTVSFANEGQASLNINTKSAVLIDMNTGTVLYEHNKDVPLPPASVTKIMTLLLVFEAIECGKLSYDQMITVSENASSMGGSQIFLEPGEEMSVNDLLKSVIIASANDAALTLAEEVGGSEEQFVSMMNERAEALGMKNTRFENVTGLDDTVSNHLTSAYDIALMSRELLRHEKVTEYATVWMDTVRNGEFGLTNTNRLIRFYRGITGLKTGYTSNAGFCVSASAKRDNLHLIAVVMGAETSQARNDAATKLLNYGFANFGLYSDKGSDATAVPIKNGTQEEILVKKNDFESLVNRGMVSKITCDEVIFENLTAPIKVNEKVGEVTYKIDGKEVGKADILACENVEKLSLWGYIIKIIKNLI